MKAIAAVTLSGLAVANAAAAPDASFKIELLDVGWARSCQGADTLTVKSTPEALTWNFSDFDASFPENGLVPSVAICVMENNIGRVPAGWRFAVDSVETSGKGHISGGAKAGYLGTYLGMNIAYVTNQSAPAGERFWKANGQSMGDFELRNTTLSPKGDLDGSFDVTAPANGTLWSPCFPDNFSRDGYSIQFSHQTQLYLTADDGAKEPSSYIDPNVQVKLNLKWEACDTAKEPVSSWGRPVVTASDWVPACK
ncbi:hypothetical protein GGR57DRAFT_475174 [Xylariaceae sp. FL1272]|nr:hypothetical protein GGR57DRAFT_475174 [Xylariaceae sp. FL1272]